MNTKQNLLCFPSISDSGMDNAWKISDSEDMRCATAFVNAVQEGHILPVTYLNEAKEAVEKT